MNSSATCERKDNLSGSWKLISLICEHFVETVVEVSQWTVEERSNCASWATLAEVRHSAPSVFFGYFSGLGRDLGEHEKTRDEEYMGSPRICSSGAVAVVASACHGTFKLTVDRGPTHH